MAQLVHISRVLKMMHAERKFTPEYYEYMHSDAWRLKRAQVLARARGQCERCRAYQVVLEVHHVTYEHFGDEDLMDLRALCSRCHEQEDLKRAREKALETQKERRIRESKR